MARTMQNITRYVASSPLGCVTLLLNRCVISASDPRSMLSSCHDLPRYFKDVFGKHKLSSRSRSSNSAPTSPPESQESCFLCEFMPTEFTPCISTHFRDEHIMPSIREYVKGSATDLDLMLLFHYSCVRGFYSSASVQGDGNRPLSECNRFYLRYRTYWPGKEILRPDSNTYPFIAAHVRRIAVQEYARDAVERIRRAKMEQQRTALVEATEKKHWACRCSATFCSIDGLSEHLSATRDSNSEPYYGKQTPKRHEWMGNRGKLVVDTRRFSALHMKVVHRCCISQ